MSTQQDKFHRRPGTAGLVDRRDVLLERPGHHLLPVADLLHRRGDGRGLAVWSAQAVA